MPPCTNFSRPNTLRADWLPTRHTRTKIESYTTQHHAAESSLRCLFTSTVFPDPSPSIYLFFFATLCCCRWKHRTHAHHSDHLVAWDGVESALTLFLSLFDDEWVVVVRRWWWWIKRRFRGQLHHWHTINQYHGTEVMKRESLSRCTNNIHVRRLIREIMIRQFIFAWDNRFPRNLVIFVIINHDITQNNPVIRWSIRSQVQVLPFYLDLIGSESDKPKS